MSQRISEQRSALLSALSALNGVMNVQLRLGSPARFEVIVNPESDVAEIERVARSANIDNPVDVIRVSVPYEEYLQLH